MVVSASDDGTVRLWSVSTWEDVAPPLPFEVGAYGLAYNADGSRLAAAGQGWGKIVLQYRYLEHRRVEPSPVMTATCGRWLSALDCNSLATGGADGTIRLRDAQTGDAIRDFSTEGGGVNVVRFSPDGDMLAR